MKFLAFSINSKFVAFSKVPKFEVPLLDNIEIKFDVKKFYLILVISFEILKWTWVNLSKSKRIGINISHYDTSLLNNNIK